MIRIETRRKESPSIGLGPMVDCVLLLLVFFLLTSSFSNKKAIEITLPDSSTSELVQKETIDITVAASGEVTLDGSPVHLEDLSNQLRSAVNEHGALPVFVIADKQVPVEKVTDIIDSARGAGIETISLATKNPAPETGKANAP